MHSSGGGCERRVGRLAQQLAGGARAFELAKTDGVPVVGREVTLGEHTEESRTLRHKLVAGDEEIGEGPATHKPPEAEGDG